MLGDYRTTISWGVRLVGGRLIEPERVYTETSMTEMYSYYDNDYKGIYTNAQVLERFSDNENWLLNLILEYERH
jgi:hypothetical protein